ncbi:MAG: DUF1285 domain-containing protein [Myxococcales bacterium]|nr:DUF1285 domain-containing protein [Myxococcales bacterium]
MSDDLVKQVLADQTIPDPVRKALSSGAELEEIRLDQLGRWHHGGQIIEHPRIADLFHKSINRTAGGTFVLEIWKFTYPIVVEDTPFFVEAIAVEESGKIVARLSDDSREEIDLATLRLTDADRLVCSVKEGRFEARFQRHPFHDLLTLAEERDGDLILTLGGRTQVLSSDI